MLEEGLTVSGKPLKDHQEVMGHARAIDLLSAGLEDEVTESRLFDLHWAVQSEFVVDICAWKREPNGTYTVTADGRQTYIEYAMPEDVPGLMAEWLAELNRLRKTPLSETAAIDAYARLHLGFVHIHPFWDGNGRLARLLSNLPLLGSGHLPMVIEVRDRKEYLDILAGYEQTTGRLTKTTGVWPAQALGHGVSGLLSAFLPSDTPLGRAGTRPTGQTGKCRSKQDKRQILNPQITPTLADSETK